jgi:hypothetical protein
VTGQGILAQYFTAERLKARTPVPPPTLPELNGALHRQAQAALAKPWPVLTATSYARFSRDGNRTGYQKPYNDRRKRLAAAVLESLPGEITDGVWLLCEETSWCLPAHSPDALPDPQRPVVDLFAAETAALLAYVDHLAAGALDPLVRRRLRDSVSSRVVRPFLERDDWWWLGLRERRRPLNNWTPWILSNVLSASLLLDLDPEPVCSRAVAGLDRYLNGQPDDGGCDEGINYWWRAGASLFESLETLALACGSDFGVFAEPKLRAIARYPLAAQISRDWVVNFADGHARPGNEWAPEVLYRFGRAVGDEEVITHAVAMRRPMPLIWSLRRLVSSLSDPSWLAAPSRELPLPARTWLPDTGVLTVRENPGSSSGLFLAAKAGHNDESHNHNDVGSFIVARDGVPLIIDLGTEVYTGKTFGPDRYDIWTTRSSWHNVPSVDGVEQRAGRPFAARDVSALVTADEASLSMDIAGAYPPEAGIESWVRTVTLSRSGGSPRPGGEITVDDVWSLRRPASKLESVLVLSQPPSLISDDILEISSFVISWKPGTLRANAFERPIEDPQLRRSWGDVVYRVSLSVPSPGQTGNIRLRIGTS